MHGEILDEIDLKLLEILQKQGRTKRGKIAEQVGLSIPSVSERMHKLEQNGIIRGYHAILDNRKIGLEITAYIFVYSESSVHYTEVIERAVVNDQILECHAITGEGSHIMKIRVTSMAALERLLAEIQSWPGVKNTTTDIVLSTAKESSDLPLEHLKR
jgi:Lrp/AsnC family leucine-responsive transcriptional regulator